MESIPLQPCNSRPPTPPLESARAAARSRRAAPVLHGPVTLTFKGILHVLCQIEARDLKRVPTQGPLLIISNHINFLEVPLLYTHLQPRPVTGFAKSETWDTWMGRTLMNLWGIIPLHRGEADLTAMRQALATLEAGMILGVTPEGTRSGDGRLRRAHPGIAWLAIQSRVPMLPIAHYGGEIFWDNLRHLRRTKFHVIVGEPFTLADTGQMGREKRQPIADAIMAEVARLLPPAYRGAYADYPALASSAPDPLLHRL